MGLKFDKLSTRIVYVNVVTMSHVTNGRILTSSKVQQYARKQNKHGKISEVDCFV